MRRLVLDTNIWLDWLVFDDPALAPLKAAVAANRAEIFIDAACEAELARVLAYQVVQNANPAECSSLPRCGDPADQVFLEAALAARADFLTRDRALLELARSSRCVPFRIVTRDEDF
jgi:predicted nucleic acid-binding protein